MNFGVQSLGRGPNPLLLSYDVKTEEYEKGVWREMAW